MGIGSKLGDMLNMNVPILLDHPCGQQKKIKQLLLAYDVKYRCSGNRGVLFIQRYLDIYPKREQYWIVYSILVSNGYRER